jgi:hypothetical protein
MRTHVRILGVVAALALGLWLTAGPRGTAAQKQNGWAPVLEEGEAKALIKRASDRIQEELSKTPKDKKDKRKQMKNIQVRAVLIAVYATSTKPGRDKKLLTAYAVAGLKLGKAAGGGVNADPKQVKQLANDLVNAKPGANGNLGNINWQNELDDVDDVMHPLDKLSKGGDGLPKSLQTNARLRGNLNGIEDKIKDLGRKAPKNAAAEAADIHLMAKEVAAIANLSYVFAPEKDEGKKKVRDWKDWSVENQKAALDLAAAARKKNAAAIQNMAAKLNSVCNKCHGVFKPD